jgi:hypothetical protein
MNFSDTTNKNGIIQTIEFWCGMSDGEISGETTKLKIFTSRVNSGFDRILPLVLSDTDALKWDDSNHSDLPIGTINIVSGQADYTIEQDDNTLDILRIAKVRILQSSTATQYADVETIYLSHDDAYDAMSPNSQDTGVPSKVLIKGNSVFLSPKPNYVATAGIKLFFEREQSYFASTDTTKEPGIPKMSHELLALYPSHDWLLIYKPDNTSLISRVEAQIQRRETELKEINDRRHKTRRSIVPSVEDNR